MNIFKVFTSWLFPKGLVCVSCKREIPEGTTICDQCYDELPYLEDKTCYKCGRYLDEYGKLCRICIGSKKHFDRGFSVFRYEGNARNIILRFKSNHALNLTEFLVDSLSERFLETNEVVDYVSFIPMTEEDELKRGYNQSEILACGVAKKIGANMLDPLEKVKKTSAQKSLNFDHRRDNLKGAFKYRGKKIEGTVLVVDDVLTTGATADEMSRVLKQKGASRVLFLTVCSTYIHYKSGSVQ